MGKAVNGGITERYIYSGVETVSVYDGSNVWKQDFMFDPTGIDRILALEQSDVLDEDNDTNTSELTRSYYHTNALGSVMMISTASEDEAASYRYTPYGERAITVGGAPQGSDPLGQSWGYTGRFHDGESGLTYYRARYQDPVVGRFLQRDPLGFVVGPSPYEFVRGNPIGDRDPSGMSPAKVHVKYVRSKSGDDGKRSQEDKASVKKALDDHNQSKDSTKIPKDVADQIVNAIGSPLDLDYDGVIDGSIVGYCAVRFRATQGTVRRSGAGRGWEIPFGVELYLVVMVSPEGDAMVAKHEEDHAADAESAAREANEEKGGVVPWSGEKDKSGAEQAHLDKMKKDAVDAAVEKNKSAADKLDRETHHGRKARPGS